MSFNFYGIAACQLMDKSGDIVMIDGMDISHFNKIIDEHSMLGQQTGGSDSYGMWSMIGSVLKAKKIKSLSDCSSHKERRCYRHAGAPILYVEGSLFEKHPNAQAAASIIQECLSNPTGSLHVGLSIEGGIASRKSSDPEDPGYKIVDGSVADGVALTVSPCNPKCVLFVENDLQKSFVKKPLSQRYQTLAKSLPKMRPSIASSDYAKVKSLAKSFAHTRDALLDLIGSIQCHHCGDTQYFKRTIDQVPARCHNDKCKHAYTMFKMLEAYKARIGSTDDK